MLYIAGMVALLFVLIIVFTFVFLLLHHAIESRAKTRQLFALISVIVWVVLLMLISVNVLGNMLVER